MDRWIGWRGPDRHLGVRVKTLRFVTIVFTLTPTRYLGSAPLVEDGSVRSSSSTLVNAGIGIRWQDLEFRLDSFNIFDWSDDDISYFYTSRLAGEPLSGVDDVQLHPFESRMIRALVSMHW